MLINEINENLGSKAGLIPYIRDNDVVYALLMKPSDPNWGGTQFQIAKGRVEAHENLLEAAVREGSEELGIRNNDMASKPMLASVTYNDGADETSKRPYNFYVYAVELHDKKVSGKPHFETGATRWITQEDISSCRADQQDVLSRFFRNI